MRTGMLLPICDEILKMLRGDCTQWNTGLHEATLRYAGFEIQNRERGALSLRRTVGAMSARVQARVCRFDDFADTRR